MQFPEAKVEQQEAAVPQEVARQPFMKMRLQIRQFAPYICDSLDLDQFGFKNIEKRQLISPMDLTFYHSKQLKVDYLSGE